MKLKDNISVLNSTPEKFKNIYSVGIEQEEEKAKHYSTPPEHFVQLLP